MIDLRQRLLDVRPLRVYTHKPDDRSPRATTQDDMVTTTAYAEGSALPAEGSDSASTAAARPRILPIAWKTLAIAVLAVFLVSLDGTVLFVAFPSIRRTFPGVSPESLSWILNAYTIGYGALLVPAGRLADRYGRRSFFLWGVALFTAASVLRIRGRT